jgi:hypothetical protein
MAEEAGWLVAAARGGADVDLIPGPGRSLLQLLPVDYATEDRYLALLAAP